MDYINYFIQQREGYYLFVDNNSLCMCIVCMMSLLTLGFGKDPKSEYLNRSIYYCILVNIGLKQQAK